MGLQRQFTLFPRLPAELRVRIWQLAFNYLPDSAPRTVRVSWTAYPYIYTLQEERPHGPTLILYRFTCYSPSHPSPISQVWHTNQESYYEFRRINPEYLQRGIDGPRIYFNPRRDTILMDLASVYILGQYVLPLTMGGWGPQFGNRFLHGFRAIRRLVVPLLDPRSGGLTGLDEQLRTLGLRSLQRSGVVPTQQTVEFLGQPATPHAVRELFVRRLLALRIRDGSEYADRVDEAINVAMQEVVLGVQSFFGDQWDESESESGSSGSGSNGGGDGSKSYSSDSDGGGGGDLNGYLSVSDNGPGGDSNVYWSAEDGGPGF